MMSSKSRWPKNNGLPLLPQESWYTTQSCPPPPSIVTIAWISVTMAWNAHSTPVPPVTRQPLDMLHIIVWQPNVISVIDGDIPTTYAIFKSVVDVMSQGMWQITVQSTLCLGQKLATLMHVPTQRTMISTPLWMMNKQLRYVEPEAQMYEGGNVTIFFLSHVFFLVSVICHPYFRFAPQYEEVDHYLLAFTPVHIFSFVPPTLVLNLLTRLSFLCLLLLQ